MSSRDSRRLKSSLPPDYETQRLLCLSRSLSSPFMLAFRRSWQPFNLSSLAPLAEFMSPSVPLRRRRWKAGKTRKSLYVCVTLAFSCFPLLHLRRSIRWAKSLDDFLADCQATIWIQAAGPFLKSSFDFRRPWEHRRQLAEISYNNCHFLS